MQPISPVISKRYQMQEIIFAEFQPEYIPLPCHRNRDGMVMSRWTLTRDERIAVAAGADIHLFCYTLNHPLQPVRLEVVGMEESLAQSAAAMGLTKESTIKQ